MASAAAEPEAAAEAEARAAEESLALVSNKLMGPPFGWFVLFFLGGGSRMFFSFVLGGDYIF